MDQRKKEHKTGQFHFDPSRYLEYIRREVPDYDTIQDEITRCASSIEIDRFLDLGSGTGQTAHGIFEMYPEAEGVLLEEQEQMCSVLKDRFCDSNVKIHTASFEKLIPDGPYCAVISAFAVHHLRGYKKKELFEKLYNSLRPGGVLAFGDVYIPEDAGGSLTPIDKRHDFPAKREEVVGFLIDIGFDATIVWQSNDLAVIFCKK